MLCNVLGMLDYFGKYVSAYVRFDRFMNHVHGQSANAATNIYQRNAVKIAIPSDNFQFYKTCEDWITPANIMFQCLLGRIPFHQ